MVQLGHKRLHVRVIHTESIIHQLPVVSVVERYSISLPGDVGLRYSIDLALETSDPSLIYSHGHWMGIELRKS